MWRPLYLIVKGILLLVTARYCLIKMRAQVSAITMFVQRLFDEHRQRDRSDEVTEPHYYYILTVDCTKNYTVVVKYRSTK